MLTLFLHLIAASLSASAEVPQPPSGLDYRLDANVTYFTSQTNFTSGGGSTRDLRNGGYFTDIIGKLVYTQDIDKYQRFYGGATYSQTESSDGTLTRTNNGLNELLAGGQFWMRLSQYKLVAAGDFTYPIFNVDKNSDDVLLGEGAMKLRLGGWFLYPLQNLTPFAYLGYEYRDGGRSHGVPYSVGAHFQIAKPFWIQAEFRGYENLFDNADTENSTTRDTYLQKVAGGSYRYFSLNPAMSELAASVGYKIGTITISGELGYMVNGSNIADGMTFMAGLAFTPGGRITEGGEMDSEFSRPTSSRPRVIEPIEEKIPDASDDGFMSEPDPRVPPPPPPPAAPAEPQEQQQPAQTPPSGGNSGGNMQLQMRPALPPRQAPRQKVAPKPKPKPKKTKKDKLDKMLQNTEDTLKGL